MRSCPICSENTIKPDGRCTNSNCEAYSHRVIDEIQSSDIEERLHCIGNGDESIIPESIMQEIYDCLWNDYPSSSGIEEDGLILEKVVVTSCKTKIHDGWGEIDASGYIILNSRCFDISLEGTESNSMFLIEEGEI